MPPAGTVLCRGCGIYKSKNSICSVSSRCKGSCCGQHGTVKCDYCNVMERRCDEIGPDRPFCGLCGNHTTCCNLKCDDCEESRCRQHIKPLVCGGKTRCKDCHDKAAPRCIHCAYCGKGDVQLARCCKRCSSCCDSSGCDKKIKFSMVQAPKARLGFCKYCNARRSLAKQDCFACGYKLVEPSKNQSEHMGPSPLLSRPWEFRVNKSRRLVGVEIEVSNYRDGDKCTEAIQRWGGALGTDGTVPDGFEARTSPANGDILIWSLTDICNSFVEAKATADHTAGLHVHVDASDYTYNDMRKMVMIYSRVEKEIYHLIDRRRATGNYSRMRGKNLGLLVSDPVEARASIMDMMTGYKHSPNMRVVSGKGIGDRYYGLNLSPWWSIGTVEFRMHHGTTKADKVVNWVRFLIGLMDWGVKATDDEANNWPTGPAGLLKICPDDSVRWWIALRYQYFTERRAK